MQDKCVFASLSGAQVGAVSGRRGTAGVGPDASKGEGWQRCLVLLHAATGVVFFALW